MIIYSTFNFPSDGARVNAPEFVTGLETRSLGISCYSTGIPVPTITWTLNNQPAPHRRINSIIVNYRITHLGGNNYQVDQGIAVSTLIIDKPQYSIDHGAVYTCIGSNSRSEDSASTTLRIMGMYVHDIVDASIQRISSRLREYRGEAHVSIHHHILLFSK